MPSDSTTFTVSLKGPEVPVAKWLPIYQKTFPEASKYRGPCTHEDCAFLLDPTKISGNWSIYVRDTLSKQLEAQYAEHGATPLKLKIYVSRSPILWGLAEWPAVRVESWHHGSPGIILFIAAVIGLILVAWAFLAWLFQKFEEIEWLPAAAGMGLLALVLFGAASFAKSVRKKGD